LQQEGVHHPLAEFGPDLAVAGALLANVCWRDVRKDVPQLAGAARGLEQDSRGKKRLWRRFF
jgi:hypothetical protein